MKTAKEIMSREVHAVTEDTSIDELAKAFIGKKESGFPVLDAEGKLIGVVTESDLIHQNQRLHIPTAITLLDSIIFLESSKKLEEEIRRMAATKVGEIMTRNPRTVGPDAPVSEVAELMAESHFYTIPVVEDDKVIGVIAKLDIVRSMASPKQ